MPSPFVFSRRALPVLIALLICLVGQPRLTGAHATLESSNPPAGGTIAALPPKLTLAFAEEVKPDSAVVEVTGPNGSRADAGDAAVDLTDVTRKTVTVSLYAGGAGAYAVHWETVSNADGHPLSGDFSFTVGSTAAPSPTAVSAAASPTAFPTEDPTNGNPLSQKSNFDSRALGISVGAGLIAAAAIAGFWFAVRPRNPKFGSRAGQNRE